MNDDLTTDEKIDLMLHKFDEILSILNNVKDEVSPIISRLEQNPMFRMFAGGK